MIKWLALIVIMLLVAAGLTGYVILVSPNVNTTQNITIKIPSGSSYTDVLSILKQKKALKNEATFDLVCRLKKYPGAVKSGNYLLTKGMNNRQIVNMLRAGLQTPVKLVIYNIRTKEDFAGLVGRTLELDSNELLAELNNKEFCAGYGLDTNTIISRFIMDNYEMYWTTGEKKFFEKMEEAYNSFWNEERKAKAKTLGLSIAEVTTLASIVEREVIFDKEMPTVAGVYLNRLKIGMPLQADPTLVFALRDFSARRVTSYHKEYDSPFNTYMYAGLPPGPICIPQKKALEAVLNAEKHNYLYFCANPDMSGYSIFSATYEDQQRVAAQYRKKLDKMNIH